MFSAASNPARWRGKAMAMLAAALFAAQAGAQSVSTAGKATTAPAVQGVLLDRVVAVVNGDVILESDVDRQRRYEEIQPYREAGTFSRERAIQRLVDRDLILQQAELQAEEKITDAELNAQLVTLRKDIPECKQYDCESDAGWKKYLGDHGFTVDEFAGLWRERMELLRFIEIRFRSGINISNDQIKAYYEKTMLPEYARRNVAPPKLETISKRIEEVLLQQQVSSLLRDWLKSLRAQGSVQMMTPGEVAP